MKTILGWWWGAGVWMLAVMSAQAVYFDHHFDADPFTNGATFVTAVQQWQASDAGVMVVNTKYVSPSNSVLVPARSTLTNTVAVAGPGVVWTDYRITPFLGEAPDLSATNGASIVQYFGSDGYLVVWTNGCWLTCSNDVWGQPVVKVTTDTFASISLYQNYSSQTAAILVNDQVVVQDLPFLGHAVNYGTFEYDGADGTAWLDDVRIQTTYDPVRLTHDRNGDGMADGNELQTYGYVARTQYVGVGKAFLTLTAALAVARDRDILNITGASYNESVAVTQNLTLTGAFTNSGTITVAAGKTVTVASDFVSSLTVSGTVALAQGVVVSGATVAVVGTVTVPTNNSQLLARGLSISGGGTVVSSGGRVVASGVDMTGSFTLDNTWGTPVTAGLDFVDDFELYADGSQMANLGFRGWGASSAAVLVKASQGVNGSKGVVLPAEAVVSNRVNSAIQKKVWTDYEIRPTLGIAPTGLDTNSYTFMGFVGTNGLLNVWNAGAWAVCSNYLDGRGPVTAMATDTYTRVSVFLNYDSHLASVFIGGNLVLQQVPFPAGAAISSYNSFQGDSLDGNLALDNIRITTGIPSGLSRAEEIQLFDALMAGSVFRIR